MTKLTAATSTIALAAALALAQQGISGGVKLQDAARSPVKRGNSKLSPEAIDALAAYNDLSARGAKAEARGDFDEAERLYREATIALGTDLPSAHLPLALLLDRQGRAGEALSEYRTVVHGRKGAWSSTQQDPVILARYGDLCLLRGERAEAAKAYAYAAAHSRQTEGGIEPSTVPRNGSIAALRAAAHTAAAIEHGSHGDYAALARELDTAISSDDAYWVSRYYLARDLSGRGRTADAVRQAALAERLAPASGKEMVRAMRRNNRIADPEGHMIEP